MKEITYESLFPLLQVQNRANLLTICNWASRKAVSDDAIQKTSQMLLIDRRRAENLLKSLNTINYRCENSAVTSSQFLSIFPDAFPIQFQQMLAQIMMKSDKESSLQPSPLNFVPKLVDFEWQIRVKSSSATVSRMSIPTCLFKIKIQKPESSKFEDENISTCVLELSKESMDAILDGLKKIHDLLSNIAK